MKTNYLLMAYSSRRRHLRQLPIDKIPKTHANFNMHTYKPTHKYIYTNLEL